MAWGQCMNVLRRLKLSARLGVLIAIFAIGFVLSGAWAFKTLDTLKVNGPIYERIVQGKDLIAAIKKKLASGGY